MRVTLPTLLACCWLAVPGTASELRAQDAASKELGSAEDPPRYAAAVGELFLTNVTIWSFNEYVRGAQFAQVSPRSWRRNLDRGWEWDDNDFLTNQFAHPFQGALYYGAARNNGLGFWKSAIFPFVGSLQWECCGETHPMSVNDWVNTGLGGVAIGEMSYRAAHVLWSSRRLPGPVRAGIAALANPVGTVHRLLGDEHSAVRRDPQQGAAIWASTRVGWRAGTESTLLSDDRSNGAYFELDLLYGDPGRVRRPYDSFRLTLQLNSSDAQTLERVQIEGILRSWALARDARRFRSVELVQGFDYVNSEVLEAGGQSLGLELREWRRFGGGWNGLLRGGPRALVLAAVDSEFAFLSVLNQSDPERLREYDFGPGYGAAAVAALLREDQLVFGVSGGWYAVETVDGSVFEGENANHRLHFLIGRAQWPLGARLSLGGELVRYARTTTFEFLDDAKVEAHSSLLKVFVQIR